MAHVLGGIAAGGVRYLIASGKTGFDLAGGFASNDCAAHAPDRYSLAAALICEVVMTVMFLVVILGATDERASKGLARSPSACGSP